MVRRSLRVRRVRWCGAAVAVFLALPGMAVAQSQPAPQMKMDDHRGVIEGRVTDAGGAVVADATVSAVNAENGAQFSSTTNGQGAYSFGALPMGKYDVSVLSSGLTAFRRRGVEVAADRTVRLDIALTPASAAQAAEGERQELLQRIAILEQRINDLESSAVLSEPETRVRRVEVFVDPNGNEHDEPVPTTFVVTPVALLVTAEKTETSRREWCPPQSGQLTPLADAALKLCSFSNLFPHSPQAYS